MVEIGPKDLVAVFPDGKEFVMRYTDGSSRCSKEQFREENWQQIADGIFKHFDYETVVLKLNGVQKEYRR